MSWPDAAEVEELFWSRRVPLAFHRTRLQFDLARSVFSSGGIDPGSALLLRYLQASDLPGGERILDLGCGQGVLGVVMHALDQTVSIVYGGTTYTQLFAGSNGQITFVVGDGDFTPTTQEFFAGFNFGAGATVTPNPGVAVFWGDFNRSGDSPPSPLFEQPPRIRIASARAS